MRPGNLCFKQSKRVSALPASNSLLSASMIISLTIPQDGLVLFVGLETVVRRRQMWIDASTRLAISSAWCSEAKSRQSRRHSGENLSEVMYLYITSPKLALPFCKKSQINETHNQIEHFLNKFAG